MRALISSHRGSTSLPSPPCPNPSPPTQLSLASHLLVQREAYGEPCPTCNVAQRCRSNRGLRIL
jgi:hypothetical protein